jgi:UDP:flavonoid glycosyltransferase YjiC (YdhE family)
MMEKGPVSVLVAPLDWGLGHATRCIPIIKELIYQGARVIIATSSGQKTLLKLEFPQLEFLEIPGYDIRYKWGTLLKWTLFFNIPGLLKQIRIENKWLEQILLHHKIDAIISDNRYGLFNSKCFSVFITHQLYIQSGLGSNKKIGSWQLKVGSWINRKIMKWHFKFISKFSECWVPDQEGEFSVAGLLSHSPVTPPIQVKYIGILSRFHHSEKNIEKNSLLILISGPEPQRTEFENILFKQLVGFPMKTFVVRGLPGANQSIPFIQDGIKIFNHLSSHELNELLNSSEFIIARSGNSTIMDLLTLRKNAILVPTRGQTEQEYLGQYIHEKKWMYSVSQKNFNLQKAIYAFEKAELVLPVTPDTKLRNVVEDFLRGINSRYSNHAEENKGVKY